MGLRLRPDMLLDRREDQVVLCKREGGSPGPVFPLHPLQVMVLGLLDGARTREEVAGLVSGALQRPKAEAGLLVDTVCSRYRQFLREGEPASGLAWDPVQWGLTAQRRTLLPTREPAPRALLWVVTECCNRRCRYCYKDADFVGEGEATDLSLSLGRVRELAREAEEIGVTSIVLTGGEPFLRPDLVEAIAAFVEHGVKVIPITKSRITGERMRALAATGLEELHVSLDSHDLETVDFLTGVPGTFGEMTETLAAAAAHGLAVVLRPTLTHLNVRHLEDLVAVAHGLGVRRFLVDTYGESCGRHDASFELSPEDASWLEHAADELQRRFPDISFNLRRAAPRTGDSGEGVPRKRRERGCVEGLRGLTFLPDGRATKCEHWPGDHLVFGDLRRQSILEVWNSERLREINHAPRERYAGTVCARCKKFDDCNDLRGRCAQSALLRYGTPFAPDSHCPIGAHGRRNHEQARP